MSIETHGSAVACMSSGRSRSGGERAGAGFDLAVEAAVVGPVDVAEGGELDASSPLQGPFG